MRLITDAGSTKEAIVTTVDAALSGRRAGSPFVGSHPLAGDHRGGVEFARADLFDGRTVVVTPTAETRPAAVVEITGFWQSLGAHVTTMTPAEHDAALAATSHLPHLVAAALAAATPEKLLPLAASGWRDTTRVAAGDPKLWQPIFATNRQHVLAALDRFVEKIAGLRESLGTSRRPSNCTASSIRRKPSNEVAMLWEIDIHPAEGQPDRAADRIAVAARAGPGRESARRAPPAAFCVQGEPLRPRRRRTAGERAAGGRRRGASRDRPRRRVRSLAESPIRNSKAEFRSLRCFLKPGVMDPVAQSARRPRP